MDPKNSTPSALALINARNIFYAQQYRKTIVILLFSILILLAAVFLTKYQAWQTNKIVYFPATADGVLLDVPPLNINHLKLSNLLRDAQGFLLDQPRLNIQDLDQRNPDNALVLHWAKQAVLAMFDYDYINYRRALQEMRHYFSASGHELFMQALDQSKNLEAVTNGRRVVRAAIVGDAVVKAEGLANDTMHAWQIFIPIDIYYEKISEPPLKQEVTAKLWVIRTSTLEVPFYGLAIALANLEPRQA